jgi:hypothetical protein
MCSLFKNLNVNVRASEFEPNEPLAKEEKRIHVRGLSLVEPRSRETVSLSKEILREFRLRDPSKNKKPNTAALRTRVQSACSLNKNPRKMIELPIGCCTGSPGASPTSTLVSSGLLPSKLCKSFMLKKPQFKLRLGVGQES